MTFLVPVSVITSSDDGNKGEGTIDGKDATRWSAKGKGQDIVFHFPTTSNVDKVEIKFYKGDKRADVYDIYYKAGVDDFKRYEQIQGNGKTTDWQTFDVEGFTNINAIKLVGQNEGWNSIVDVRFLVSEDVCNCCKDPCECCKPDEPKPDPVDPVDPEPEPKPEPEPEPEGKNKDSEGVEIQATIKKGGQTVKANSKVARSKHNQSNEKNILRDSIYGSPKEDKKNDTVNYAVGGYINTELSKPDQIDFKRLGGGHSDSNAKEGRCYPVGVMVTPGKPSTPYIAKEYPKHSDTPKFSNKVKVVRKEPLPDLNGKTFGLQTIGYATKDSYKFECWLDLSVLDKKVSDLKTPPNKWELYYTAEDKGDWVGEPYLEHQGLANKGTSLMLYGRIDHVTKPTEVAFCAATEIEPKE